MLDKMIDTVQLNIFLLNVRVKPELMFLCWELETGIRRLAQLFTRKQINLFPKMFALSGYNQNHVRNVNIDEVFKYPLHLPDMRVNVTL